MRRIPRAALLCTMLMAAPVAQAAQAAIALSLKDDVAVSGRIVTLADVATIGAGTAAERRLGETVLGAAPRPGAVARLGRGMIERALRSKPGAGQVEWSGAETVTVRSATRHMPAGEIGRAAVEEFERRLAERYGSVNVRIAGEIADVEVRPGECPLTVRARPSGQPKARETAWVDIVCGDVIERTVAVPLAISVVAQGWFARHDIAAGAVLNPEDLELREVDLAQAGFLPLQQRPPAGARAARSLRAGDPVSERTVAAGGAVLRGDTVQVTSVSGAVSISVSGVALGNAHNGGRVEVRLASGSVLDARVTGNGQVVVE